MPRSRLRWKVERNAIVQIHINDSIEVWCVGMSVPGAWLESTVIAMEISAIDGTISYCVGGVCLTGDLWVERNRLRLVKYKNIYSDAHSDTPRSNQRIYSAPGSPLNNNNNNNNNVSALSNPLATTHNDTNNTNNSTTTSSLFFTTGVSLFSRSRVSSSASASSVTGNNTINTSNQGRTSIHRLNSDVAVTMPLLHTNNTTTTANNNDTNNDGMNHYVPHIHRSSFQDRNNADASCSIM